MPLTIKFEIFAVCVVTKYKAIKARVLGRKTGNCKCANLPSFAFVAMAYIHNDDEQINNRPRRDDAMCVDCVGRMEGLNPFRLLSATELSAK